MDIHKLNPTETKLMLAFDDPLAPLDTQTAEQRLCSGLPKWDRIGLPTSLCSHCDYGVYRNSAAKCEFSINCANCGDWCKDCCLNTPEGRAAWPSGYKQDSTFCSMCINGIEEKTKAVLLKTSLAPKAIVDIALSFLILNEQVNVEVRVPPRMHVSVTCGKCKVQESRTRAWIADFGDIITCYDCTQSKKANEKITFPRRQRVVKKGRSMATSWRRPV